MTAVAQKGNGQQPVKNKAIEDMAHDAFELEQYILGSVLMQDGVLGGFEKHGRQYPALKHILTPDDFYWLRNKRIYEIMLEIDGRGIRVDDVLIIDALRQEGTLMDYGGAAYFTELINTVTSDFAGIAYYDNYEAYARRLIEITTQRRIRMRSGQIVEAGADFAKVQALQAENAADMKRATTLGRGMLETPMTVADQLVAWHDDPQDVRGYRTGIRDLDMMLGGMDQNELMIILGYAGSGKSTLAMQIALSFCEQGPGLIIPTEMSPGQWRIRMIAYLLGTDYQVLRRGQYDDTMEILKTDHFIEHLPIHWFGEAAPTPAQIKDCVTDLYERRRVEWVLVDGLHDIRADGDGVYDKTNQKIDCLHELARLGLVVVATGHLNRGATEEPNPRDALGSSRIEQRATAILTLYRPGQMVESGEMKELPNGISKNLCTLRLAKSRFSQTGMKVNLMFGKRDGRHGFHPVEDR